MVFIKLLRVAPVPVTLTIAAVLVVVALTSRPTEDPAFGGAALSSVPVDTKEAAREIKRVRKELKRMAPASEYIVINTHANKVYLRTADSVLLEATCSSGSGGELVDSTTGRHWTFATPTGVFAIDSKIRDPWWRKPDWAYIEENSQIPKNESERLDPEMMGAYAIGFGNGYFIHGTLYERLLGIAVTHGCVRLGSEDLRYLYEHVRIGTPVYVF